MTSTCVLATITTIFPAAIVVAGPSSADQYSLIGALCASVIVLMVIRKFDQTIWNAIAAFIGSLVGGVAFPGTAFGWAQWAGYINETSVAYITWHAWMLFGFICGLGGWAAAQAIYHAFVEVMPGTVRWIIKKLSRE